MGMQPIIINVADIDSRDKIILALTRNGYTVSYEECKYKSYSYNTYYKITAQLLNNIANQED